MTWTGAVVTMCGENLVLRDVTIHSGWVYNLALNEVTNIDVLHLTRVSRGLTNFWTRGVITVEAAREQVFENILFENIRVQECPDNWVFADVRTRDITQGGLPDCHTDEAGHINGLVFRNIHLKKTGNGLEVGLSSHDRLHPVGGVRFENVTGYVMLSCDLRL